MQARALLLAASGRAGVHAGAGGGGGLSTGALLLAVLAAVLVLGCLGWAMARALAWEPEWILSLRHALAEAGFRASATWSEFTDWARLGR